MLELKDKEYNTLREYVYNNYGISLNDDKKSLVFSRLRTLIVDYKFDNFEQYYNYLISDKSGKAANEFINRISTNHTYFMREKDHFDYLNDVVLPEIEKKYKNQKDVRLWCAASSSGEEPYTLQIILREYFENKGGWNTQLLASDVSTDVLSMAYRGVYSKESLSTMPTNWVQKYFKEYDKDYMQVIDKVRSDMIFRKINLMDPKLESLFKKKLQVIFCRNVMIYFNDETRNNLVAKLYNIMEDGGILFVGHSESLNYSKSPFQYVMPAVYRKQ